jgi:8-oxo-dGTP pyrophosphatase MutT (NUDIX family)
MPIVSNGFIVYNTGEGGRSPPMYLMICRKDSLGYVDFLRGKYSLYNISYILNMMTQMTVTEKHKLRTLTFDAIWKDLWGHSVDLNAPDSLRVNEEKYVLRYPNGCAPNDDKIMSRKNEDMYVKDRFYMLITGIHTKNNYYNLNSLLDESETAQPAEGGAPTRWETPEWGFPKGRKNYQEKDLQCALREFEEETGYSNANIQLIENLLPFEEIFIGSNYKSYKHKYYLAHMTGNIDESDLLKYERGEVSQMCWFTYEACLLHIRSYNTEKKRVLTNIHNVVTKFKIYEGA